MHRQTIVSTARGLIGCAEADGSHRAIIDTYNGISPLPRGYRMSYTDPWCAAFVSAVGQACGASDVILPECACDPMIALYKAAGRWVEDDGYIPSPGDIIMYDWGDSGAGDCTGSADHVGIVESCDGSSITVIEGNISDAVGRRTLAVNGRYIRGFCLPGYDGETGASGIGVVVPNPGTSSAVGDSFSPRQVRYLRRGMTGEDVRALQLLLIGRGYGVGGDGADGDFGRATLAALVAYQRDKGLDADGELGPDTLARLISG